MEGSASDCLDPAEQAPLVARSVAPPSPSGRGGTTLLRQRAPRSCTVFAMTPPNEPTGEGGRDDRGVPYHAESTLSSAQVLKCKAGRAGGAAERDGCWFEGTRFADADVDLPLPRPAQALVLPGSKPTFVGLPPSRHNPPVETRHTRHWQDRVVNELACGGGGRVHGAKCLATLAGVA